jgi:hypothetical protein
MDRTRRLALVAGVFYLLTIVASLTGAALLAPVIDHPDYVLGPGQDTQVLAGGLLYLVNVAACIGTAVALFPVVRRRHEGAAIGFVASRLMEAAIITVGVLALFTVVTLRREVGDSSVVGVATGFVALRDWTFLLGDSLMPAVNALLLGSVLYRARLVPRWIPTLGLIGAPLQLAAVVAALLRADQRVTWLAAIAVVPIFLWELSLGIRLVGWGFRPEAVAALESEADPARVVQPL